MMRRPSHQVAAVVALVCLASFAAAEDIATFSDVQLIEEQLSPLGVSEANRQMVAEGLKEAGPWYARYFGAVA